MSQKIEFDTALRELIQVKLPAKAELIAQSIVDESFRSESWKGDLSGQSWPPRKEPSSTSSTRAARARRNANSSQGARDARRALLVKSSELIRSIQVQLEGDTLSVSSDKDYAQVHNEGLQSGRGAGFKMPQRQFMPIPGEAFEELERQLAVYLEDELNRIFG